MKCSNRAKSDFSIGVMQDGLSDDPFSSKKSSITVKASVKNRVGYEAGYDTVCAKVPESRELIGDREEISLYPYGCAKLHMTELPII